MNRKISWRKVLNVFVKLLNFTLLKILLQLIFLVFAIHKPLKVVAYFVKLKIIRNRRVTLLKIKRNILICVQCKR